MQIITLGLCKPSCLCIVNCEKECFNIVWRMYFKALNIGWYPNFTHTTTGFCSRLWLKYHSDSKETKKEQDFFLLVFFLRLPKECVWNYSQAAFMHLATTAAGSETLHRLLGILSFSLVTMHFWNYTTCLGRFVPLLQKCSESREDIIFQSTSSIKLDLHSENEVLVYAHKMRYI